MITSAYYHLAFMSTPIHKSFNEFMDWYRIKSNMVQLLEFLMDYDLIVSTDDVTDLVTNPERYNEIWRLYQKEIVGV